MIIGIPDKSVKSDLPSSNTEMWDYVIHRHEADRAGLHYDLRMSPPGSDIAYSWAIPKATLPNPYEKVLAVKQPDHTREYMSWKGTIEDGYGKGKVTIAEKGKVEVLESSPNKINFNIYTGTESKRFVLIKTGGDNWLLLNYTPTRDKRDIPDYKPKYKDIKIQDLKFDFDDEYFAPKYDGSHSIFHIRKDHGIDTFSYRPSKRSKAKLIDHTFKTDLFKVKPNSLNDTVLRGEVFGVDSEGKAIPSSRTGGMLNASVLKSREKQQEEGKLDHVVFDIVRFKGKNVEDLPYSEKFKLLEQVHAEIPEIKLPPLARTTQEKEELTNKIQLGEFGSTDEGVIVYKLNDPKPLRSKIKNDFDVYVTGIFPGTGKYANNAAGGFEYSMHKGGPKVGRVGSGFTDAERRDMWENPQDYVGRVAKVVTERQYHTGSLRIPIFKEWRYEMFPKRASSKKKISKYFRQTMRTYRNGKFIGQSPIYKVYSSEPLDVGRWTNTLHTRGNRKGYLK